MKSCLKTIMTVTGLVLIGIAVIFILAATQLDRNATGALEQGLSYVYQSKVEVEDVRVALAEGALDVNKIRIMNPPEFKEGPAIDIERVRVSIDWPSLFSETPRLTGIEVLNPHVFVHYKAGSGTNIGALIDSASRFEARRKDSDTPLGTRRRFVIDQLESEGGAIQVSTNLLPVASPEVNVASFTIEDVAGNKPLNVGDMGVLLLRSLFTRGMTPDGMLGPITDRLKDILGGGDEAAEGLADPTS